MAILDFLSRKGLNPAWAYRCSGVIWRLAPSESGLFLGEARDIDSKEASFFCLDQRSGKLLWEERTFVDQWWVGIEVVHHEMAFLHGFMKPDMPQHNGITAVNLRTGLVAWSSADVVFALAVDNSVYAFSFSPEGSLLCELDSQTGTTLHTWEGETDALKAARARVRARADEPEFPSPLVASTLSDERASIVAYNHSRMHDIIGAMEVLQNGDLLFLSYHERESKDNSEGYLRNTLKVIHLKDGRGILTETLNSNVSAIAPDSFFLHRGMLYFIKDRSVLTAVSMRELHQAGHHDR